MQIVFFLPAKTTAFFAVLEITFHEQMKVLNTSGAEASQMLILIVRKQNCLISFTRSNRSRCIWQFILRTLNFVEIGWYALFESLNQKVISKNTG